MKKTYVTTMPDHVGAFLKASRAMAALGLNITRVSYNKAIDTHTLFIEADGEPERLELATEELRKIGYLQSGGAHSAVLLVEFKLRDIPGGVSGILELIAKYHFNISYLSSQTDGSGWQMFKMGLFVEKPEQFSHFLHAASRLCPVRVLDYDKGEKILDNSIFYISFASELAEQTGLGQESRTDLIINANLIMQMLDERNKPFHKTFDYIRGFAEALATHRGAAFAPRITEYPMGDDLHITLIEPPCGSNVCILRHQGMYLFIDTGYACYRQEMLSLLHSLIPDFDSCRKAAFVTHADVDHCGLLDLFSTVYLSKKSQDSLIMEREVGGGFREQNPLHAPYIRICKILTSYKPPRPEILQVIGGTSARLSQPLERIGRWSFGTLEFEVYEGQGGHLPGELVLVERQHHLAFTGDIFINIHGMTQEQTFYNHYAPYLMTSVDTDSALCTLERQALPGLLGPGEWHVFGGHGQLKELSLP